MGLNNNRAASIRPLPRSFESGQIAVLYHCTLSHSPSRFYDIAYSILIFLKMNSSRVIKKNQDNKKGRRVSSACCLVFRGPSPDLTDRTVEMLPGTTLRDGTVLLYQ
eukprot:9476479-Pyramimonas_sp.AAC.1